MNFEVSIVHSVDEIAPEAWDRLSAGRPFSSHRWYRFGEAVKANDRPLYIVLSAGGEPVARATFWLTWEEPLPLTAAWSRRLADAVLKRWPLMLCRSPLSSLSGLVLPDDPALRDPAARALALVAREQARRHRASMLAFDYLEPGELHLAAWPGTYMPMTVPDPGTRLNIDWPDFESYLATLSRKTRKNYRRNCRKAEELGVVVTAHDRVTRAAEAMPLIRSVEQRHNSAPNPWMRGALDHADMVDSVWLTAEAGGKLVGCELMLGDGDTWFLTALGLDYDVQYVYFVIGYADIARAIKDRVRVLRWGSGAYEAKARLGFELEQNNHMSATFNSGWLRWLARRTLADDR